MQLHENKSHLVPNVTKYRIPNDENGNSCTDVKTITSEIPPPTSLACLCWLWLVAQNPLFNMDHCSQKLLNNSQRLAIVLFNVSQSISSTPKEGKWVKRLKISSHCTVRIEPEPANWQNKNVTYSAKEVDLEDGARSSYTWERCQSTLRRKNRCPRSKIWGMMGVVGGSGSLSSRWNLKIRMGR